jgi:hypothetical protein
MPAPGGMLAGLGSLMAKWACGQLQVKFLRSDPAGTDQEVLWNGSPIP